jgi:enoyl-CoA hydratase/carnithine racemase
MHPGFEFGMSKGVARVTFTRPETRNALTRATCRALHGVLAGLAGDPACRLFIIQGSGGSFMAGADIAELNLLRDDRTELIGMYRELRATQELLYGLAPPTLALIDGFCLGAGLSFALACDLRIATPRSEFGASPARIGLLYSPTEVLRLALRVGTARARDLLFTGRRVTAEEALRLGLIERLTTEEGLEGALAELSAQLGSCSPASLRKTKSQLLRLERAMGSDLGDDSEAEEAFFGNDAAEGILAFLERRSALFKDSP